MLILIVVVVALGWEAYRWMGLVHDELMERFDARV